MGGLRERRPAGKSGGIAEERDERTRVKERIMKSEGRSNSASVDSKKRFRDRIDDDGNYEKSIREIERHKRIFGVSRCTCVRRSKLGRRLQKLSGGWRKRRENAAALNFFVPFNASPLSAP